VHRVRVDDYISVAVHGCFWIRVMNKYVFLLLTT
jgi:G:T-mismatch repair DNA endonuclease (very short patch repair protein)